ncbi:MAG: DNA sulfur modification protein DndB [Aureliella sp.]
MGKRKRKSEAESDSSPSFTYRLPVVRAIQAGQEFFTSAVPFSVIGTLTQSDRSRSAEGVDQRRVTELVAYIRKHRETYVLPAITASIGAEFQFTPNGESVSAVSVGVLTIPIESTFEVHDGRYRCDALAKVIEQNPDLADEAISVVLYPDGAQAQRRFGDIRAKQRRSARSERIVSDPSDEIAQITRDTIASVDAFTDSIEMVKTTISNRSKNLFTFSALYQANEMLLKPFSDRSVRERTKLAVQFWNAVQRNILDWTSGVPRVELRKQTVHAHGVTLCAIAFAGAQIAERFPKTWERKLKKLQEIDWSRGNKQWEGKAMLGGRMTKSAAAVELTAAHILKAIT